MVGPTQADASFPIESPPQSCLELLAVLRGLESLVTARIQWKATWPAVDDKTLGMTFPVITYDGPTQSPEEALLAEHRARRNEFNKLQRELPKHFTAIGLRAPKASDFEIPRIVPARGKSVTPADCDRIHQVSKQATAFWVRLAARIQAEVFNHKELIPTWIPEIRNWPVMGEPPANGTVYPPFPIQSLFDMETWLARWIERCALPDPPTSSSEPGTTGRQESFVTIQVPSTRPPFRSPVEKEWRCSLDDLARELRNCSRTFHAWGLPLDTDREGDPPDFSAAEDRAMRVIKGLRKYRQTAFKILAKRYSVVEIGQMPVAELLTRLTEAPTEATKRPSGGGDSPPKKATRKTGRPKGSITSNPKEDKRIYDLWKQGQFRTKAEFARNLPAALQHFGIEDVVAAIERQRKRLRTSGNN